MSETTQNPEEKSLAEQLLVGGAAEVVTLEKPIRGMKEIPLRQPTASDMRGVKILDLINMDTMSLEVLVPRVALNGFNKQDFLNLQPKDLFNVGLTISGFFAL